MNIELYKEKTKELVDNTPLTEENIFEYDYSPYADEFDDAFSFYQENLKHNARYGIDPSIVFFNSNFSKNAWASKQNNIYIISFNMGLVVHLIQMFQEKEDLLTEERNKDFFYFEKLLDNPIHILMHQNSVHFTFYHEMGHLVQKSDLLENRLYEHLDNSDGYLERRHLLELDADEFSSISIGAHILQYAEKMFGDEVTKIQFENLIVISCSSIFLYFLSFESNKREIYYEKFTHPHPVIRVMWIVFSIVGYCTRSLEAKGIDLGLNGREIVDKTFEFSESISGQFFEDNLISDFNESLGTEITNIIAYLTKFQALKENDETLAVHKWNQIAQAIKEKE